MDKKDTENIGLRPIIVDYLRHWKLIIGVGLFSLVIAVLYLVLYPKTYETMARIQIQDDRGLMSSGSMALGEAAGMMKSFGLGGIASGNGISIDNEISTLYSNHLMRQMVTRLGLYVEYTPTFRFWYKMYGEEPIKITCDSATIANLDETIKFKVSVSGDGKVKIQSKVLKKKQTFRFDGFPAIVELKEGRFVFDYSQTDNVQKGFSLKVNVRPPGWVAEDLASEMNIEDYSKTSDIIELTYSDHQKQRSKDVLNTLIRFYNDDAYSYKKEMCDASMIFLNGRIESIMDELSTVEQKIEAYKSTNKITDVLYDIQYYAEYMKELKSKTIEIETQANMVDLMDVFIKDPANKYKLVPSLLATGQESEGSPLFLYNQALLEREKALKSSNEENPVVQTLTKQADQLRENVYLMIDNAKQSTDLTLKKLENREKELVGRMGEVPEQERVYVDYKRQQEILQGVYLILLQKREEIALSIGQNVDKAKIVDAAFVKSKPIAPRKLYAAIIVVVLTLLISIGWLFCKTQVSAIWALLKEKNDK